jgi:hypothetical protein
MYLQFDCSISSGNFSQIQMQQYISKFSISIFAYNNRSQTFVLQALNNNVTISFSWQLAAYLFKYPVDFLDHQFPHNYYIILFYLHLFDTQNFYAHFT